MNANNARESERRHHSALSEALKKHLARNEADEAYYEAWSELTWEYGRRTPFSVACQAWAAGDAARAERAMEDERRLEALARRRG